ncbi:DNA gyrase/topoisomerase IV subunit B [Pseudoclavibacter caeni]|uniref:DNA topoisomerase (ATP-hydrolyzing) n=1 Tax=Pseudoclavibacter caeni TaxID=908846 RepID=A0A7C8FUG0_9MICO|nr:DNA topoisomerase IV subunit B [Pseudoclavibacter caeni]KAB1632809.1 type IIA DNA topoisomerase subunit B [Pseudoclavibacter caeni]NYJ97236.1 DNA gyrase subunit B [Pseudoclavibacter caeni]
MAEDDYSARQLSVLEGLEAVRKRPGMYIGSTDSRGLMHCLWEIIDNAVDEALGGHGDRIEIIVHDDESVEVRDRGRGIPVDVEPKTGLTGLEVVMVRLHAGGKFGGGSYTSSGGLHGVGASVVNALSERLDVQVDRDGRTWQLSFHRGTPGVFDDRDGIGPASPFTPLDAAVKGADRLQVVGRVGRGVTGTRVRYWADPQIFTKGSRFSLADLEDRARQTAFLVPGLELDLRDDRPGSTRPRPVASAVGPGDTTDGPAADAGTADAAAGGPAAAGADAASTASPSTAAAVEDQARETFRFDGGIAEFVDYLAADSAVTDTWRVQGDGTFTETVPVLAAGGEMVDQEVERTCHVDVALRWGTGYDTTIRSFVNIIATPKGGTHQTGFEQALLKTMRQQVTANARRLKAGSDRVEKDDVLAGLTAVVTVRVPEPQFEGQTKEVLGTPAVRQIVARIVAQGLRDRFASKRRDDRAQTGVLLQKIVAEMKSRISARAHKETLRRKNALETSSLPAKLVDCRSNDAEHTELFIVEGDSALGTAKMARDSEFQALLPIRGKILNVQKASMAEMLNNAECAAIIQVVGAGSGRSFDITQARYERIIMMSDADVDGAHIRTLLLTLFFRYMRPMVEAGRVFAAVPPLHRLIVPARGRRPAETIYTYSEEELHDTIARLRRQGRTYREPIQRYKGLGEMDADQLAETTMDPRHRLLRRVTLRDLHEAEGVFDVLMGSEVAPRRRFIMEASGEIDRDRIDA